jgi:transcriptional regulator with XRE-family HTH domain
MGTKARPRLKRLPKKLRQIRDSLVLSQTEILHRLSAENLITYHQISRFETGTREPPYIVLLNYARIAGVPAEVLLDDELDLPEKIPGSAPHDEIRRKYARRKKR